MASPVTDPAILAQLNAGERKPVSDPALLAQLNGDDGFRLSDALTDIPAEIGRTFQSNLETFKQGANRADKGPIEGLLNTGKAALAVPGMVASPITGAAKSLIGHPMAYLTHKAGEVINPEVAAKDDPKKMYEAAAGDVETALLAAKPGVKSVPKPPVPTVAELKDAARAAYKSPEVEAVRINPQSTANLAAKIENDLAQQGFRPKPNQGAPVFEEVRSLVPPRGVSAVSVADLDSARKALGVIAKEKDLTGAPTANATAARTAIDHINDYLPNLSQADVMAGDAAKAAGILDEARSNWGAAKRAQSVDLQLTRAERQAAKSGAGSNIENSMRQKIATLLDNPKRTVGFSDAEKAAMEAIVRGTPMRNVMRKAGKLGVDGGLSLAWNTAAALGSGGATLPITVGSTAARKIGEAMTAKAGRQLSEMIRSRSAAAQGNKGMAAVRQALLPPPTSKAQAIPYAAIASAMLASPQRR